MNPEERRAGMHELEREGGASERLLFFTDAVLAIAVTLLAIELPVPEGATTHEFLHSIREDVSHYIAFVVSFAVIARAWQQHHHISRFLERSDDTFRALNTGWLFTIVLLPFATKLLTVNSGDEQVPHAIRWGFYALLQVVESLLLFAMVRRMRNRGLQSERTPEHLLERVGSLALAMMAGFGVSIPLFFVWRQAWILWFTGPVVIAWGARMHLMRKAGFVRGGPIGRDGGLRRD